ncbi:MAG: ATP-binding protein, partial [Phormidesmis sp.]
SSSGISSTRSLPIRCATIPSPHAILSILSLFLILTIFSANREYECKSLLITANQPFSQWDTIFADDMMTVAAVDRLVHHALIVEIHSESYCKRSAAKRGEEAEVPASKEDSFLRS